MKTQRFIINLFATLLLAPPLHAAEKSPRPNHLFILADDLGYGDAVHPEVGGSFQFQRWESS